MREGGLTKLRDEAHRQRTAADDWSERTQYLRADFRIAVVDLAFDQRDQLGIFHAAACRRANRFTTKIAIRVGEEEPVERPVQFVQSLQSPEGLDAAGGIDRAILCHLLERGSQVRGLAVHDLLPRHVTAPGGVGAEMIHQLLRRHAREIECRDFRLVAMTHAPDASAHLVAFGMIPRHFVVRNDLVVPIDNVEAAVGTEMDGHGAEPFVGAADEVGHLQEFMIRAFARQLHRLDALHDRVREIEHIGVRSGETSLRVGLCETGEPGTAHRQAAGAWHVRRVRPKWISATRVTAEHVERHHRITVVIGFLDEDFALAIHHEAPDVAWPVADLLEGFSIRREPAHDRAIEFDLFTLLGIDLGIVESPLRNENPAAGRAGELMRHQMRIANAKTGEHHFARVGLAVVIGVAQEQDVRSVRYERAILVWQYAERN